MSWRSNAQRTGENAAPLGTTRRWGGGQSPQQQDAPPFPSPTQNGASSPANGANGGSNGAAIPHAALAAAAAINAAHAGIKRDREETGAASTPTASSDAASGADGAPRKRRSRWGDASEKVNLGVTTALGAGMSQAELDRYAVNVRLEEISRKFATGDFVPPERERSPSPPPIYDSHGRRTNTREVRYRKKLEEERVQLIDRQLKLDPNYRPPAEYHAAKRNLRPTEKVYLPVREFPDINFFGLLVGPRGNTLKKMERESGAKISIRGKGSVKEGKGRPGADEDEEDMHCVVQADEESKVKLCIKLINQVIETAASTPEAQNDHKRNQLRELAALNGTLRDDENQICQNCGQKGHRKFECPEERNWTAHIICHRCGGQGHLARDCSQPRAGAGGLGGPGAPGGGLGGPVGPTPTGNSQFDSEYANLMAELGEGGGGAPGGGGGGGGPSQAQPGGPAAPGAQGPGARPAINVPVGPDGKKIPPWRDPSMWNQPTPMGPPRGPRFGMGFNGPPNAHQPVQQAWGGYGPQQAAAYGGYGWNPATAGVPQGVPQYPGAQAYLQPGQPGQAQAMQMHPQQMQAQPQAQPQQPQQPNGAQGGEQYAKEWAEYYAQMAAQHGQGEYAKEWAEYYRQQAAAAQAQQGAAPAAQ